MILETTTGTCVGSDHGGARIVLPFLFEDCDMREFIGACS